MGTRWFRKTFNITLEVAATKDVVLCDGRYVNMAEVEVEVEVQPPNRNADNDVDFFGFVDIVYTRLLSASCVDEDCENEQPVPPRLLTPLIVSEVLGLAYDQVADNPLHYSRDEEL